MKKLIVLCALTALFVSCKHEEKNLYKDSIVRGQIERAAKLLEDSGTDTCHCLTAAEIAGCPDNSGTSVIKQYIPPPATHSVYTIHWTDCLNNQDPSHNCNRLYGDNEVTSTVDLCWFDCSTVTAKFSGKPPCLPCYPDNFCIQIKPIKTINGGTTTYELSGSFAGQGAYEGVDLHLTVTISTDPDITINCTTNPGTTSSQIYTCYGSF